MYCPYLRYPVNTGHEALARKLERLLCWDNISTKACQSTTPKLLLPVLVLAHE